MTSALSRLRRGEDVQELQPFVSRCCQQHEPHPEAPCAGAGGMKEALAPGAGLASEHLPSPFSHTSVSHCGLTGHSELLRLCRKSWSLAGAPGDPGVPPWGLHPALVRVPWGASCHGSFTSVPHQVTPTLPLPPLSSFLSHLYFFCSWVFVVLVYLCFFLTVIDVHLK